MQNDKAHRLDKIKTWTAVLAFVTPLFLGAGAIYADSKQKYAELSQQVNTLSRSNERNYEVFDKLADSVNRLSESVARLEERTRYLEGN